jgi:hypothetical protein
MLRSVTSDTADTSRKGGVETLLTRTWPAVAAHGRIVLQGEDRDEETMLNSWQYYVLSDMSTSNGTRLYHLQ